MTATTRRPAACFAPFVLALLLGACTGAQFTAHTAKNLAGLAGAAPRGGYKLGQPYRVGGVWYRPADNPYYDQVGTASWYGAKFHGRRTANGAIYDMNALTAAHKTLPMPSQVRVTNLENGRSVILTVNDRGPFIHGRIIDVSRRGAQLLGFYKKGTARVRVQTVTTGRGTGQLGTAAVPAPSTAAVSTATAPPPGAVTVEKLPPPAPVKRVLLSPPTPPATVRSATAVSYTVNPGPRIYVQAGAFIDPENARRLSADLGKFGPIRTDRMAIGGRDVYRVRLGPIETRDGANALLGRLARAGYRDAYLIAD